MQAGKATAPAAGTAVPAKPDGTAVRHEMNGHANGKLNGIAPIVSERWHRR